VPAASQEAAENQWISADDNKLFNWDLQ